MNGQQNGTLVVEGRKLKDATPRAFLLGNGTWLPKSQIVVEGGMARPDRTFDGTVRVTMPRWLAEAKGLAGGMTFEPLPQAEAEPRADQPPVGPIHDGFYTVVDAAEPGRMGTHRTLMLRTYTETHGKQMVAVVHEGRTEGVGWLIDGYVEFWRRASWLSAAGREELHADLLVVAGNPEGGMEQYALRSKRCSLCNTELTHPDSIRRYMGPVCSKKYDAWTSKHRQAAA